MNGLFLFLCHFFFLSFFFSSFNGTEGLVNQITLGPMGFMGLRVGAFPVLVTNPGPLPTSGPAMEPVCSSY